MVAGVVALVRQANPLLTYRDVKLILAETAKRDKLPSSLVWHQAGTTYTDANVKYHYNDGIGFGIVDAAAAVNLAKTWRILPSQKKEEYSSTVRQYTLEKDVFKEIEIPITNSRINFVEFIQLSMHFRSNQENYTSPMSMYIVDPSGKESQILWERQFFGVLEKGINLFLTGYNLYLGKTTPNGRWKLKIKVIQKSTTHIEDVKIRVYGH